MEKVKECFEDAVSDQGWILIFNFQRFMELSTQKSYVLHTFSSYTHLWDPLYLLEGVTVFGEATTETWCNWATRSTRFENVPCRTLLRFNRALFDSPVINVSFPEHFFLILFLISSKSSLGLCKNLHEIFAHVPKVSAVFGRATRAAIFISKIFLESKYTKGDAFKKAPTNQWKPESL